MILNLNGTPVNNQKGNYGIKIQSSHWCLKHNFNIYRFDTFKYHVFVPMGRFQLELIYLYFLPSFCQKQLFDGKTVENKGKLILSIDSI